MEINDHKLKDLLQLKECNLSSFEFIGRIHYVFKIGGDIAMTYQHRDLKYLIEFAHRQIFDRVK